MEEIVDRIWVVIRTAQSIQQSETINEFETMDLELCYLQVRKSFECIMFMSLLGHRMLDRKMKDQILREYHPGKIRAYVRKHNPKFFPIAVDVRNESGKFDLIPTHERKGFKVLTEADFFQIYDKVCGYQLHAHHDYKRTSDEGKAEAKWLYCTSQRTLALLSHHKISLDDQFLVLCNIGGDKDGKANCQFFRRYSE